MMKHLNHPSNVTLNACRASSPPIRVLDKCDLIDYTVRIWNAGTHSFDKISTFVFSQVISATTTMARAIPWSPTGYVWPTTYFWIMASTERWKSTGHTRPRRKKWQNSTVMTTSDSSGTVKSFLVLRYSFNQASLKFCFLSDQSDLTTWVSTTNRCSVSTWARTVRSLTASTSFVRYDQ